MSTPAKILVGSPSAGGKAVFDAILRGDDFFAVREQFTGPDFASACEEAAACFAATSDSADEPQVMRGFLIEGLRLIYAKAMDAGDWASATRALSEMAKIAGLK